MKTKVTVCNLYRPPRKNNNLKAIRKFIADIRPSLNTLKKEKSFAYLAADFNINLLKIHNNTGVSEFFDFICSKDFLPQITIPTRFHEKTCSLIDNILVNGPANAGLLDAKKIISHVFLKRFGKADHQPCLLAMDINISKIHPPKFIKSRKATTNAEENMKNDLKNRDLLAQLDKSPNGCPNTSYSSIISNIQIVYDTHFPEKQTRFKRAKHKIQPWMTNELLHTITVKDKFYVRYHKAKHNTPSKFKLKHHMDSLNQRINHMIIQAKESYYSNEIEKNKNDMKKTWNTINNILNKQNVKSNYPPFFLLNDKKIEEPQDIANEFNTFFASIGQKLAEEITQPPKSATEYLEQKTNPTLNFKPVTSPDIQKIINNLQPKTSTGYDNISCKVIKLLSDELSPALAVAINQCLNNNIFPDKLKLAKVIPLYKKKGQISSFENWRPIALLPALSKVYERIIFNQIYEHFVTHSLFSDNQYGFRKKSSTEDAILDFQDRIKELLNNRETPFSVFLDLSKAFDTIDHSILLSKLAYYGFSQQAQALLKSYLTDRSQFVFMDGISSEVLPVRVGVPQGSILGPLLFIIYVNDAPNSSDKLKFILFADDTSLISTFFTFTSNNQIDFNLINKELDNVFDWLCANKLSLNVSKTKFMVFRNKLDTRLLPDYKNKLKINGKKLAEAKSFNFLGVTIDPLLKWDAHTKKVNSQISRTLGVLRKIKRVAPVSVLKTLYHTLILPKLTYGIKAWGYAHAKVFKIQKKAVRVINLSKYYSHTDPIFINLKLLKIADLFKYQTLVLHYKIERGLAPTKMCSFVTRNTDIHRYHTRQYTIRNIVPNFLTHSDSMKYHLPVLINSMPSEILRNIFYWQLPTFKKHVKQFFINQYSAICLKQDCPNCNTTRRFL